VVIDDFPVVSSARQAAELQQKADHFVRYIGNQIPRARLTRQLDQAPEYPPRGSALTSGEDVAKGVSLPTRIFAIDVGRGDVTFDRLVLAQEQGAAGLFARAMGSYIHWLAPDLEARTKAYHARVAGIFQALAARGHFRTPQAQASLQAGAEMLFEFARDKGAITDEEYHRRMEACAKALVEAGGPAKPPAADPAGRFLSLIRSALVSGRAHLVNDAGEAPDDACGCGWEWKGSDPYRHLEPRGERIGTVDDKHVFLNAAVALAVVRKLARETGDDFEVSARTLHKRLYDDKRLVTAGDPGETYLVRHTVAGLRNRGYLHLLASDVLGDDDRQAGGQQTHGSVAPQPPVSLSELEDEDEPTIQ
jgi:hypothetical protein